MKSTGSRIFVTMDSESESDYAEVGGVMIQIINEGMDNQAETTRKTGIVARENELGLPIGTILFFHHFVAREKNWDQAYKSNAIKVDGEKLYLVDAGEDDLFAYIDRNGNVIPWGSWVFIKLKQRESTKSGLIIATREDVIKMNADGKHLEHISEERDRGYIKYAHPDILSSLGVSIGDEVITYPGVDYRIQIKGEEYARIHSSDIVFRA